MQDQYSDLSSEVQRRWFDRQMEAKAESRAGSGLNGGGGDGTSGGMEARIAKLEADLGHIKDALGQLRSAPIDLATLKERSEHLATRIDVQTAIDGAVDRLAARVQRQVAITAALATLVIGVITVTARFLAP